jgi:hypothetical protein
VPAACQVITGPSATITAPASGATVAGIITVTASAQTNDPGGIAKVEFFVDGDLKGTATTSPYNITLDTVTLNKGNHTLVAKAHDTAGKIGTSASVTISVNNIIVDNELPVISVSESGASGLITFNATASDNVGVTKAEFYVDGILKGTDTTSPYTMSLDSRTLTDGNHALLGKAYDTTGNIGTSTSVAFTVNNAGPTPTTYNEVESNGSTRTANAISDNVTRIVAYIGTSTDQDYFKINVAAGRTVTVNMTGPARDYDLYLLRSSGTTLKTSADAGSTESVTYTNTGTATATYYIKVIGFGRANTPTTPYNLALSH